MKKRNYLLWSLAIVCGLTVQSCTMDYDEPAGVTALREATADLISAQAAVENAEVAIKEASAAQMEAVTAGYLINNQIKEIDLAKAEIELAMKELELAEATADTEVYLAEKQAELEELEREQELLLVEYEADMLDAQSTLLAAQEDYEKALSDLAITLSGIDSDQLTELTQIINAISTNRSDYYDAVAELVTLNLNYLKLSDYTYDSTTYEATLQWDIDKQEFTILSYENLIANYEAYNGVSYSDTSALATLSTSLEALIKQYNEYFDQYEALSNSIAAAQLDEQNFEAANTAAEQALATTQNEAVTELSETQNKAVTELGETQAEAVKTLTETQETARIATYTEAQSAEFKVATTDTDVLKSLLSELSRYYTQSDLEAYGVVYVSDVPAASGLDEMTLPTSKFSIVSEEKVTTDNIYSSNTYLQERKIYSFNSAIRNSYASYMGISSTNTTDEELAEAYTKYVATTNIATDESIAQLAIYKANYESALTTFTAAESAFKAAYEPYKWGEQTLYEWFQGQVTAYEAVRVSYRTEDMQKQLAADLVTYAKARAAIDGFAAVRTTAAVIDPVTGLVTTPESYEYWYEYLATYSGWQSLFDITPAVTTTDPVTGETTVVTDAVVEKTLNSTYLTILGSLLLNNDKNLGPADTSDGLFNYSSTDKTYSEYAYGAYYWAYNTLYGGYISTVNNVVTYATTYTFEEACKSTYLVGGLFNTYVVAYNNMESATDQATVNLVKELNSLYALTSPAYVTIKAKYDALEATVKSDAEALTALYESNAEVMGALVKSNTEAMTTLTEANTEAMTTLTEANDAAEKAMKSSTTEGSEGSETLQAAQDLIAVIVGTPTTEIYTKMSTTTASNDIYKISLSSSISGGTLCLEINQLVSIYNDIVTTANAVDYDSEILAAKENLIDAEASLATLEMKLAFVQAGGYVDGSDYLATKVAEAQAAIEKKEAEIADLEEIYTALLAQKSAFLSSIE